MTAPIITAIIPTYNSAEVVQRAIESIETQTRKVDEIIVVDDGSRDDTRALLGDRPGIRYAHQPNAGASAARNHGARLATGDWLAFLDADDTWEAEKIERQMACVGTQSDVSACVTNARVWSPSTGTWVESRCSNQRDRRTLQQQLFIRNVFTGICSSLLIRRDLFERLGGFAVGKGSEDRRIALDILRVTHIHLVEIPLIRQQPGPAHFHNPETQRRHMLELHRDYRGLSGELNASRRIKLQALSRIHERSGMHYLENGDLAAAIYDLAFAAALWPWQPNPWRVFINAMLGRAVRKPKARDSRVA